MENILTLKNKFFYDIIKGLQNTQNEIPLLWDKVKMLVDGEIILSGCEINSKKKRNATIKLYDNITGTEYKCTRWRPSVSNRYRFRKADIKKRPQQEWDNMLLRIAY